MNVSEAGYELIKRFEGCRLEAYPDPATGGKPYTIGYGHAIGVKPGDKITQEEADQMLVEDVEKFGREVLNLVKVELTQGQFDALVSFTYNLGTEKLADSTLLEKLNSGDIRGAADQFTRWVFANNVFMPGLKKRRDAERAMFLA